MDYLSAVFPESDTTFMWNYRLDKGSKCGLNNSV